MDKVVYEELGSIKISEAKYLVISKCSKGGYTIGQKMIIKDGDKTIEMFLKGAIHINNLETLKEISDCILEIAENA